MRPIIERSSWGIFGGLQLASLALEKLVAGWQEKFEQPLSKKKSPMCEFIKNTAFSAFFGTIISTVLVFRYYRPATAGLV
jgi:hypothetical protein